MSSRSLQHYVPLVPLSVGLAYTIGHMLSPADNRRPTGETKGQRIRSYLDEWIESSHEPGLRLPTERELAQRFGVTRMTVRHAFDRLEMEGRIYRVRGSGTFVAHTPIAKTITLTSFSEDMLQRGLTPGSRLVLAREEPAGASRGFSLGISPGNPVVHIERVRTADGLPMALESVDLPAGLVPGLLDLDLTASLYATLDRHFGIRIEEAEQQIQSSVLSPRQAVLLEVPKFSPALFTERISIDQRGRRVERATSVYRSDRYSYQLRILRPREHASEQ